MSHELLERAIWSGMVPLLAQNPFGVDVDDRRGSWTRTT